MKNDSNLFFTCSLIEFIGRRQKLKRSEVAAGLGEKNLRRIYEYADVFHCEPIEKTADEYLTMNSSQDAACLMGISTMRMPVNIWFRIIGRSVKCTNA